MNRKRLIKEYMNAKETYVRNLSVLKEMQRLLLTIDKKSPTMAKIQEAENLEQICIQRIENLCQSLENKEDEYIKTQSQAIMADSERLHLLFKEIDDEVQKYRTSIMLT